MNEKNVKKVAVVTGASQGIGAALVQAFVARGYRVVANSRSIAPSESPDVLTVAGDIADPRTAEKVVAEALAKFGRVDVLINNAGVFTAKPFIDYTEEDYRWLSSVNLDGFFYVTQHAARQMLKQGSGHIVNVSTTLADQPIAGVPSAITSLTKGGLNAVTKSLAIEFADKGVRVNALALGVIRTPMHKPESLDFLKGLSPMKRLGEIQEVVDAVMYLESAQFVTGEIMNVDGGSHAGKW